MPEFTAISEHQPGVLDDLLTRSYRELLVTDVHYWTAEREGWRRFDADAFERPDTIGRCVFITVSDGEPVGFGSFDPRQAPEAGIVGHNVVVPEFRRRGIGRSQVEEIVRRLREVGARKAVAVTSEHPFFIPAQKMYVACGFKIAKLSPGGPDDRYRLIEYERELG